VDTRAAAKTLVEAGRVDLIFAAPQSGLARAYISGQFG